MAKKRQAISRKEREKRKKQKKAAEAQRNYKASPKGKQYQPKTRRLEDLSHQNHAKKLEQGRASKVKQKANNEVKRTELLKIDTVTEAETKLDPELQACLDDVTIGVQRLRVKSTEPHLKWIEEDVFNEEGWKQSAQYKARISCPGPPYLHGRLSAFGKLCFVQTYPRKTTSQPHNYKLTREATNLLDRSDIIERNGLYKEGMKISYRECRRCGRETWLNFDDHLGECNEIFGKILQQRIRLKNIRDSGRIVTRSDVEVIDAEDETTKFHLTGRFFEES